LFAACTEVSIDTYIKAKAQGASMQTGIYQPVDALGTLIAFMLKYHGDGSSHKGAADAKAFYLTKGELYATLLSTADGRQCCRLWFLCLLKRTKS
jgi:hypothetical protein